MAGIRTSRARPTAATASTESASPGTSSAYTLPSATGPPPKLLILPKRATPEARVVTLPNPRHGRPARYLVCPETGIYEFTKIVAPKSAPRSWLVETQADLVEGETGDGTAERKAQTVMHADLYVATAIDPLFLVLRALAGAEASEKKHMFLSSDHLLERLSENSSHLSEIFRWNKTRALVESRMAAVCDTVEAGDESMYRLSGAKLLAAILDKARKMSDAGLPPSMEDKFVKRALEAPVLLQKRDVRAGENRPSNESAAESQESTPQTESSNTQSTAVTAGEAKSSASQPSNAATQSTEESSITDTVVSTVETSPEIIKLQRLRVAFGFICSSYVSPTVAEKVQQLLKGSGGPVDFSPLDEHLAKIAEMRAEALASGFSDLSQKRSRDGEDDEARAEKKRKMEEEKKRKATESRGVRELKKVNTSGMKKLSEFFKAK